MKCSKYNIFYKIDSSNHVIYNARTGAMAGLSNENYIALKELEEHGIEIKDKSYVEKLEYCGFIVTDDTDELKMIRYNSLSSKFSSSTLALVIAPTSDCNFRCIYCYEKDKIEPIYMNNEVQDKIIELVNKRTKNITNLNITWYGGEPLLCVDIIEKLSSEFIEICSINNINYTSNIITNGYLLTTEVAHTLVDRCKIEKFQITLDGDSFIHNIRRPHKDNSGTFETIIENLHNCKDILSGKINLRVNTDKQNYESLDKLCNVLEEHNLINDVFIYLGNVISAENIYEKNKCFSDREFNDIDEKFNLRFKDYLTRIKQRYPYPINNCCYADFNSSFIIDANGYLYKCFMDIGNKNNAVGNLCDDKLFNNTLLYEFMLYDATEDEQCKDCKYLPLCLGGCPHRRLNNNKGCTHQKYMINYFMKYIPMAYTDK